MLDLENLFRQHLTRRALLGQAGTGAGLAALASLMHQDGLLAGEPSSAERLAQQAARAPLAARAGHFPAKAKNVIFMHMVGAPSQLDLFDYKPELKKRSGELAPKSFVEGKRFAFLRGHPRLLGTSYKFKKCGQSGAEISELLPHLQKVADELCFIKTVKTEEFNHGPAQLFFQTGFGRFGRPSVGSWVTYGLGSENRNMPAFVVLVTGATPGAGNSLWGSGFLPSVYQGIKFRRTGDPVLFLSNPKGMNPDDRRRVLDGVQALNAEQLQDRADPEIKTRMAQYEMAFRMQSAVPDLMDISREPKSVHKLYGTTPGKASFSNHCLLARRLVERGVRFVQLYDADWDHHGSLDSRLRSKTRDVDQGMAALITDLKQRGLLDDTLVVWGGEFGRTPMLQGVSSDNKVQKNPGRDHHKEATTVWMAGGGIKPSVTYGQTDEFGYYPAQDGCHVHDVHATLLHVLGLDHEKLTFKYQGRPFRLTDVAGHVLTKIIA